MYKPSIEEKDLEKIVEILKPINPKFILEIGTWKGYSAKFWIDTFHPVEFITIEKDCKPEDAVEDSNYTYCWNTDSHVANIHSYVFDFLFIDGDHSYEGVKQDFEKYSPLVRKGGIVMFHDALYHADKTEEVDIFWNEIKQNYKHLEIKESPNSTGVGVLYL